MTDERHTSTYARAEEAIREDERSRCSPATEQLLPCPFCGTAPSIEARTFSVLIYCSSRTCGCAAEAEGIGMDGASEAWNRRATQPAAPAAMAQSDELKAANEEIERLRGAKRRALALADERAIELNRLKARSSAGSASPCLNCGDPSDELFCGTCREMGCSIPPTRDFDWSLPNKLRADFLHGEIAVWNTLVEAADEIERLRAPAQAAPAKRPPDDPAMFLIYLWRECPEEKRPSVDALLDRIRVTLSSTEGK